MNEVTIRMLINWELLRSQQQALRELVGEDDIHPLAGLIPLLEAIQDQAVDANGLSENQVFGEVDPNDARWDGEGIYYVPIPVSPE